MWGEESCGERVPGAGAWAGALYTWTLAAGTGGVGRKDSRLWSVCEAEGLWRGDITLRAGKEGSELWVTVDGLGRPSTLLQRGRWFGCW